MKTVNIFQNSKGEVRVAVKDNEGNTRIYWNPSWLARTMLTSLFIHEYQVTQYNIYGNDIVWSQKDTSYQQKYEALLAVANMLCGSVVSRSDFSYTEWTKDLVQKAILIEDDLRTAEWIDGLIPNFHQIIIKWWYNDNTFLIIHPLRIEHFRNASLASVRRLERWIDTQVASSVDEDNMVRIFKIHIDANGDK